MWIGSSVIGSIGLGLGYISPVSTLVKWFSDRPGMAIMGFGGRCDDRRAIGESADELFQNLDFGQCRGDLPLDGSDLLFLHGGRCISIPAASAGLAARWLDAAERNQINDYPTPGTPEGRAQDAAVLANLVAAVPERVSRHRRDCQTSLYRSPRAARLGERLRARRFELSTL